jgi:hypothetical protein
MKITKKTVRIASRVNCQEKSVIACRFFVGFCRVQPRGERDFAGLL